MRWPSLCTGNCCYGSGRIRDLVPRPHSWAWAVEPPAGSGLRYFGACACDGRCGYTERSGPIRHILQPSDAQRKRPKTLKFRPLFDALIVLKIPWGSPPVWVRFPPPAPLKTGVFSDPTTRGETRRKSSGTCRGLVTLPYGNALLPHHAPITRFDDAGTNAGPARALPSPSRFPSRPAQYSASLTADSLIHADTDCRFIGARKRGPA